MTFNEYFMLKIKHQLFVWRMQEQNRKTEFDMLQAHDTTCQGCRL